MVAGAPEGVGDGAVNGSMVARNFSIVRFGDAPVFTLVLPFCGPGPGRVPPIHRVEQRHESGQLVAFRSHVLRYELSIPLMLAIVISAVVDGFPGHG
jgi:hypothetical protein